MLKCGIPSGPYMIISRTAGDKVDAYPIDPTMNNIVTLQRENVYECKTVKLRVSMYDMRKIVDGSLTTFIHSMTKEWENAAHKDWDVVILYSNTNERAYFSGCEFKKVIFKPTKHQPLGYGIRIFFGRMFFHETIGRKNQFCI